MSVARVSSELNHHSHIKMYCNKKKLRTARLLMGPESLYWNFIFILSFSIWCVYVFFFIFGDIFRSFAQSKYTIRFSKFKESEFYARIPCFLFDHFEHFYGPVQALFQTLSHSSVLRKSSFGLELRLRYVLHYLIYANFISICQWCKSVILAMNIISHSLENGNVPWHANAIFSKL